MKNASLYDNPEAYDKLYKESTEYQKAPVESRYYPIWASIGNYLNNYALGVVIDLGCGSGQLAEVLFNRRVVTYLGVDFSSYAIEMARSRFPRLDMLHYNFVCEDVMKVDFSICDRDDVFVSTECFEHIKDDRALVRRLVSGSRLIFSVPDFPYINHYRVYHDKAFIREYYGLLLDINEITRFEVKPGKHIYLVDSIIR